MREFVVDIFGVDVGVILLFPKYARIWSSYLALSIAFQIQFTVSVSVGVLRVLPCPWSYSNHCLRVVGASLPETISKSTSACLKGSRLRNDSIVPLDFTICSIYNSSYIAFLWSWQLCSARGFFVGYRKQSLFVHVLDRRFETHGQISDWRSFHKIDNSKACVLRVNATYTGSDTVYDHAQCESGPGGMRGSG